MASYSTQSNIHDYLKRQQSALNIKICVLGKQNVGKTTFINQYLKQKRKLQEPSSKGSSVSNRRQSDVETITFLYRNEIPVDVEIWDTVG